MRTALNSVLHGQADNTVIIRACTIVRQLNVHSSASGTMNANTTYGPAGDGVGVGGVGGGDGGAGGDGGGGDEPCVTVRH